MDMRKSGLVSSSDSGSYSDLNRLNQLKVGDKDSDAQHAQGCAGIRVAVPR